MNGIQDTIIEDMSSLDEWFDKYAYIIKKGDQLEPMDKTLKIEANAISGCQSKVWLTSRLVDNTLNFQAASDARITKGILALLLQVCNNQLPEEIIKADFYLIKETGLGTNLSPSRANGLASIIKQIQYLAKESL